MTTVGIADLNSYHETTCTLLVTYERKEARILLQGLAPLSDRESRQLLPLFDQEARQEICRRGMLQLIEALSEWERSGAPITSALGS
jgi:hypothetical protein